MKRNDSVRRAIVMLLGPMLLGATLTGCRHRSSPVATASESTVAPPTTTTSSAPPVASGFAAVSATFVSARSGYVLGRAPCSPTPCSVVRHTVDGGRTWRAMAGPPTDLNGNRPYRIRFADAATGWVFGDEGWLTRDGGAHWSRMALPGFAPDAAIFDLEAAGGVVHAVVADFSSFTFRILSSHVGTDHWTVSPVALSLGAGPVADAQLVLHGAAGWLVTNNRGLGGGARLVAGRWRDWQPTCPELGAGSLAAGTATDLVLECSPAMASPENAKTHLLSSTDGGTTFQRRGRSWPPSFVGSLALANASTIALNGLADDRHSVILVSRDGGRSWRQTYRSAEPAGALIDLGFTTATQGIAIEPIGDDFVGRLLMTRDGGRSWTPVPNGAG